MAVSDSQSWSFIMLHYPFNIQWIIRWQFNAKESSLPVCDMHITRTKRKWKGRSIKPLWNSALHLHTRSAAIDETRFSTIQPSIDVTGIRNKKWQWRKNDAVILVALIACTKFGVNRPKQTKVIERKLNFYFSNSDLDLDHRHLGSNPMLHLHVSYPYTKFGVNRPKQTKLIEWKLNFYFK